MTPPTKTQTKPNNFWINKCGRAEELGQTQQHNERIKNNFFDKLLSQLNTHRDSGAHLHTIEWQNSWSFCSWHKNETHQSETSLGSNSNPYFCCLWISHSMGFPFEIEWNWLPLDTQPDRYIFPDFFPFCFVLIFTERNLSAAHNHIENDKSIFIISIISSTSVEWFVPPQITLRFFFFFFFSLEYQFLPTYDDEQINLLEAIHFPYAEMVFCAESFTWSVGHSLDYCWFDP